MEKTALTPDQYNELMDMIIHYGALRAEGLSPVGITSQEAYEESNVIFDKISKYLSGITDYSEIIMRGSF